MFSTSPKPKWWQLYLTFPLLVALFALDARLRLSVHEHEAVQIGIVLLVYGLIHFWLRGNKRALSRLADQETYGRITVIQIPLYRSPLQESHEKNILQIPSTEAKGMLGDTFEMDVIDARALPVEENTERAQQEEKMTSQFRPAFFMLLILTVITGVIYPLVVTGIAQVAFPHQANGSLILVDGRDYGSTLIGQQFDQPRYFWGRPSAAGYNAAASSGSNYGPMNPHLLASFQSRVDALKASDPGNKAPIPVDLVTASGSGLDPDISVAAAMYQVHRVATARGLSEAQVTSLVDRYTQERQFGFLGEPRVNVLELNLALDGLQQ